MGGQVVSAVDELAVRGGTWETLELIQAVEEALATCTRAVRYLPLDDALLVVSVQEAKIRDEWPGWAETVAARTVLDFWHYDKPCECHVGPEYDTPKEV